MPSDRPYPARTEPLPRHLDDVTPEWLTGLLVNRYPGIVVRGFDELECKNSHTTKLRVRLDLNDVGGSSDGLRTAPRPGSATSTDGVSRAAPKW